MHRPIHDNDGGAPFEVHGDLEVDAALSAASADAALRAVRRGDLARAERLLERARIDALTARRRIRRAREGGR